VKLIGDILLKLEEKISNKSAKIGIVGLGYVGLPLAVAVAEASKLFWYVIVPVDAEIGQREI